MLVYYVLKGNQLKHYSIQSSDIIRSMADSSDLIDAYCLRRTNHSSDLIDGFNRMFKDEVMTDVTLMCADGHSLKAHRMVLSACSPFFRTVFDQMPDHYHNYPVVILKDMSINDLRAIVEFIYRGEVTVGQEHMESVIKSGESLRIKGLDNRDNYVHTQHIHTTISHKRRRRRHRRKSTTDVNNKNSGERHEAGDDHQSRNDGNSSDEYVSEYSDGNESNHSLIGTPTELSGHSHTYNESVGASEGDIEPSRLLEQSMITGDTESNSINQYSCASTPHPMSAVDDEDVKPNIYEEPIGLISQISSALSHDCNSDLPFNHTAHEHQTQNLLFDASGIPSIPGTSSQIFRNISSNEKRRAKTSASKKSLHSRLSVQSVFHTRQQRFHCHLCHQGFTAKRNLQRHMQIHNYYRNKFECEHCQRQFSWKHTLNIHVEKAHHKNLEQLAKH